MNYGSEQGWGDYPDERGAGSMSGLGDLTDYIPSWVPGFGGGTDVVGPTSIDVEGPAGIDPAVVPMAQKTSPEGVRAYAAKLRALGYSAPDTGDVFDEGLRSAVRAFQQDHQPIAGTVDGLMGPTFFRVIDAIQAPAAPATPGGGLQPIVAGGEDSTAIWWVVGGGALLAGLAAWYYLK